MDAYRAVVDKRDQRAFLPKPIPEDALRRILQAGRMTGSSKNSEPNRFIVIRDRDNVIGRRHQDVWRDAGILNDLAVRGVVLGDGENQRGSVRNLNQLLH